MLLMQDGKPKAYTKRDQNFFVLDLVIPGKIMQVNGIANATRTTGWGKLTHLDSRSKKVQVWQTRFGHVSNTRIICASKLLTGMGDFNADYNKAEIYSNFEVSKSEDLTINNADLSFKQQIILKASKITDSRSDFDKIYELYIGSKQTRIVYRQKPMISTNKRLEKVHINFWGPHDLAFLSESVYVVILICEKTGKI